MTPKLAIEVPPSFSDVTGLVVVDVVDFFKEGTVFVSLPVFENVSEVEEGLVEAKEAAGIDKSNAGKDKVERVNGTNRIIQKNIFNPN